MRGMIWGSTAFPWFVRSFRGSVLLLGKSEAKSH